jgi:predicted Rossmann fold nucleotide-binding protein DprA/Smf involved in DNA uptake
MKLLIVGSRSITDFDLSEQIPEDVDLIISGGASGVDTLAERYADEHRISKLVLRPQYERYGRGAPLKRNETMVDLADEILVVWDGVSKGTAYTVRYAEKQGKRLRIVQPKTP